MKIISVNCCSLCKYHKKEYFDIRCEKSYKIVDSMDTCDKFEADKCNGIFKLGDHCNGK